MSRNHSKNLSLTFFVPANPHYMGIRVGISKKPGFVQAIVLQLGDTIGATFSYKLYYWSYTEKGCSYLVSTDNLLQTSYSVILRVICVKNHVVLVRTSANKKRSCINL